MFNFINAFKTLTKSNHPVYRVNLNVPDILSRIEQGETRIALDVVCRNGFPFIVKGTGKNGKPYEAIQYYVWSKVPTETQKEAK